MPRGPLPDKTAIRRNKKVPTQKLPAAGYDGEIPDVPSWRPLGESGTAWWLWAWRTPQAAAWNLGDVDTVSRRASLEDDLAAIEAVGHIKVHELLGTELGVDTLVDQLDGAFRCLGRLAGGRMAVEPKMLALDKELGLAPHALANNRWEVVDDGPAVTPQVEGAPEGGGSRGRLTVVRDAQGA